MKFSEAAQRNIDETAIDPTIDVANVRIGTLTHDTLLAVCLDGADPDRVQGWRDYVATVCEEAERGTEPVYLHGR